MMREGTLHRAARFLWRRRSPLARLVRLVLLPFSALYTVVMAVRSVCYRVGILGVRRLPLPTVAVGNRAVGGAGKTPVAAWIAAFYASRGRTPAVLLRGYGGDEPKVHERLVPGAVVVADPDRVAGAARALAAGADVIVLDDAFQTLGVARDLNLALVSAENTQQVRWLLPAGPWRETTAALGRADGFIVTRKRAALEQAQEVAGALAARWPGRPVAIAHLAPASLEGMVSGRALPLSTLAGHRVLAVAGIADPESYAVQVRSTGASVQLVAYQDHHPYGEADLQRIVRLAAAADYVVVTEKDAVKLRHRWPADVREPLVAVLAVRWESGGDAIIRCLESLPTLTRRL